MTQSSGSEHDLGGRCVSGETVGVTGATGFLGSSLLDHLIERGYRVRALTRSMSPRELPHAEQVQWLRGDLLSERDCACFVEGLAAIVHLAHSGTPLTSNRDLPAGAAANLIPTLNLLQATRAMGGSVHVVFASTGGAMYKPSSTRRPFRESSRCEPDSSYGLLKLVSEQYLRMAAARGWVRATCLRIANPYGVILPAQRLQGLIGVALDHVIHGRPIRIFGSLDNVRDYVHVTDVARAFECAMNDRAQFGIYNIGSGRGYAVRDVLDLMRHYLREAVPIEVTPDVGEAQYLPSWAVLDIGKARARLGWSPAIPLDEGLQALCDVARARRG